MKSLSKFTKAYLIFIYFVGGFFLFRGLKDITWTESALFLALCISGSILHIFKVEGATNRSHYTLSFLIFGFAILHFNDPLAFIVIVVSNIAEWVWNRPPWFIQLFNIGCYIISTQIAMLVYTSINPLGVFTSWQLIAAIALGMASFTLINHMIVGIVVSLARGENFKQSGIFDLTPLLIDLTTLAVGASLALVWNYNPYALFVFLAPAYPLYMTLKIPALERKTEIDQKTGLYNHQYFMNQLNNELQRANRYDRPFSIIMADLDLLRNINNTYGHLAGDDVLKGVANTLKQTVRDYDIVARFGGEEFAILLPETEIEKAIQRAEHIRRAIESASFVISTSVEPIKVTMSFGIAKRENFEQSPEEILHHADTALYRSKLGGRNQTLAYVNNTFLSTDPTDLSVHPVENNAVGQDLCVDKGPSNDYSAACSTYLNHAREINKQANENATISESQPGMNEISKESRKSIFKVYNYIIVLGLFTAVTLFVTSRLLVDSVRAYSSTDWLGLASLTLVIILTEWFSVNLYVKNTALSTSAVPIATLIILFGPLGTLAASTVFAITAAVKYRSPFNRIVFNFSNHILTGMLINLLIHVSGIQIGSWKYPLLELAIVLSASIVMFICTTVLISIGVGIDQGQSSYAMWKDQYSWMVVYYIGMGFITFALMFAYVYAGLLGILTMVIPLALLRISQVQYVEHTRAVVNQIRSKNQELEKIALEISTMNEGLLITLSEIIDLQDPHVLGHSKQVSKYAADMARSLGLNEKQTDLIRRAGLLHDIGKLGISKEILTKPARLTPREFEIIKTHSVLGSELLKNTPSLRPLIPIVRHHHEFYNGEGYPDKLSGNQIPIEARIVAVADALEAMISDRPYRKALKPQDIIEELNKHSGTQFDPLVVREATKILAPLVEAENGLAHPLTVENLSPPLKINMQTT